MRWIAFLRAVNVGGRTVSMPLVRDLLADEGFAHLGTYIASGNVFLTTGDGQSQEALEATIERVLRAQCGFEVPALARPLREVVASLKASGFPAAPPEGDLRRLILFAKDDVVPRPLPWDLPRQSGTVIGATRRELFVEMDVGARVPNPAAVIEKELGAVLTGRFGHTVHKIVAAAGARGV